MVITQILLTTPESYRQDKKLFTMLLLLFFLNVIMFKIEAWTYEKSLSEKEKENYYLINR